MTPKEKADEFLYAFLWVESALFAVDEILKSNPTSPIEVDWDDCGGSFQYYYPALVDANKSFWEEVKLELIKLQQ